MEIMNLRRTNEISFTDEEPTKLMEMISHPYSLRPIFFVGCNLEVLHERAWSHICELLKAPTHQVLLQYLKINWYSKKQSICGDIVTS